MILIESADVGIEYIIFNSIPRVLFTRVYPGVSMFIVMDNSEILCVYFISERPFVKYIYIYTRYAQEFSILL